MQFSMLVESRLLPIPESIKTLRDFGRLEMLVMKEDNPYEADPNKQRIDGHHMYLEGEHDDIVNWLKSFGTVWITKGHPMMQEFEGMDFSKKE